MLNGLVAFISSAVGVGSSMLNFMLIPAHWVLKLAIVSPIDPAVLQRRMMRLGWYVARVSEGVANVTQFMVIPMWWLIGRRIMRVVQRRVQQEREKFLAEQTYATEGDVFTLPEATASTDQKVVQSMGDLILLVMLTALGELFIDGSTRPSIAGKVFVGIPDEVWPTDSHAAFRRVLAQRRWHIEQGERTLSPADAAWAARVTLLFQWRRTAAAVISKVRSRNHWELAMFEFEPTALRVWLEAWVIENRVTGVDAPFECLQLVKERRHMD